MFKGDRKRKTVAVNGNRVEIQDGFYRDQTALEEALKLVDKIHRQKMRAGRGKRNQVE